MFNKFTLAVVVCVLVTHDVTNAQVTCTDVAELSCITDATNRTSSGKIIRALTGPMDQPDALTQESCAAFCFRYNFTMAGVEDGTQCFCGDSINPDADSKPAPMSDCEAIKCNGNSSQVCGGADRLLLLKATCSGTPLPNFHGCADPVSKSLPYCDTNLSHSQRLADLASRMTLEDKIAAIAPQSDLGGTCACHTRGKASIGLPNWSWLVETNTAVAAACYAEGKCAVTFSGPLGMAASFNKTNWYNKGSVLGTEMRAFSNAGWHRGNPGDYVALTGYGPNINIARDPRFGRTSELPGEDPFLNGVYAINMVGGMQEKDAKGYPKMLAYLKHFTAYSRETNRGHDTYNITMQDLWESFLPQYKLGFVNGSATGAMCSYNAENGRPSCANNYLLNEVVRGMWNRPDAHITTDCGAVTNLRGPPVNAASDQLAVAFAVNNGTDIEMGSSLFQEDLLKAVQANLTTEEVITRSFMRSYAPHFIGGRFDPVDDVSWTKISTDVINSTEHRKIQYDAAVQSFVLLKNDENKVLPMKKGTSVAVLGPMGETRQGLLSDYAGDQQCWNDFDCIPTIAEAIGAANKGGTTTDAAGVDVNSKDTSKIAAAVELAKAADVVVLVMGNDKTIEHEGHDRSDTALPGEQENLAKQVLAVGKPTVLVLCNGGALAIDNLIAGPNAIVEAFNPSVMGPVALADTLFGDSNKFGKLPYTMYPHDYINQVAMDDFSMSKAPGRTYRYYQGTPLFQFGFGMSYTTFDLQCTQDGNIFTYSCTVSNTGSVTGDEVVQVYHSVGADVRGSVKHPIPIKSLCGFERVTVAPGKQGQVSFSLPADVFDLVNEKGEKQLYPGTHLLQFSYGVDARATTISVPIRG